ncbi:hypothetical protein, partial [Salmonella sp. s55962]|uniref:hypothetical protein n=1 Tax=Salmonella sp. s55962 TaxID=3159685 RepID=UPI003980A7B8
MTGDEFVETAADDFYDRRHEEREEQVPEDTYEQTRYFEELQNIPEESEEETPDTPEERVSHSETVRTVVTTRQVISSEGIVEHTEVKV